MLSSTASVKASSYVAAVSFSPVPALTRTPGVFSSFATDWTK